ncbi:TetR/AcrR family transcriptional regulator [Peribacillus frigoritolerans]|nr:TetR/AcrR family transcriptional regulator [Peribacillus frigoritolerans]
MASIHEDMVQKTKKQIQLHFIALIEAEGFSHVSVKKIAERANINRGTFYLHYSDKYELMDHLQQELLHELQTRITAILPKEAFFGSSSTATLSAIHSDFFNSSVNMLTH